MSHSSGSVTTHRSATGRAAVQSATLIWIDSRQAFVVHWHAGTTTVSCFESDVPVHRRTTGRGDSDPQDAVEGRRLEHLTRFVESIAGHIPAHDDLLIIGPGTVHEQLAQHVELADRHARRQRLVACRTAGPMTERQLMAELRSEVGAPAPRKKQTRRPVHKAPVTDIADPFAELETLADDISDRSR